MDKKELYEAIAERKFKPKDLELYEGGNGRVDRCAKIFLSGQLAVNKDGILLDVGGGIGDLGYALRSMFSERYTLDISEKNLSAAAEKGNLTVHADVDKDGLIISDASVDAVVALDFIEHIIDPEKFARECFRVLKPGGVVFINTPNIQYWRHIESIIKGIFPHTSGDREVYHGGHLGFYAANDMFVLFSQFNDHRQWPDDRYDELPKKFWDLIDKPKDQKEYVEICMRYGYSNLLFSCRKP